MSETMRGFVLLLSIALWLPALRPFLDGQLTADQAALRYGGALLLSWGGVSLLAAIIRAYTPEPEPAPEPTPVTSQPVAAPTAPEFSPTDEAPAEDDIAPDGTPRRRAEDLTR